MLHFDKHTRTMNNEYNFLIQAYRISDHDEQLVGFKSMSKGTKHHQKQGRNVLNTNQSGVGPRAMKLLKDSFNDEVVDCVVCK
eukprot:14898284-Ditylum_brightwellii.AAC.1